MTPSKKTTPKNYSAMPKSADARVLKRPRITEKAANAGSRNTYLFDVAPTATKSEIAKAFFALYKQKPIKVNTVSLKPKVVFRRGRVGTSVRTKKAYVSIAKGATIQIM